MEELTTYETRFRSLQQENDSMKRRLSDSTGDFESKATKLMQEVERLNLVLKDLNEKNYNMASELDSYKRKENQYLGDIERLNNTLRLKVEESTRWQS